MQSTRSYCRLWHISRRNDDRDVGGVAGFDPAVIAIHRLVLAHRRVGQALAFRAVTNSLKSSWSGRP
jgi:hypothetical protein